MQAQPQWHQKSVEITPQTDGTWKVKHDGQTGTHPGQGQGSYPHVKVDVGEGPHMITFQIKGGQSGVTFSQAPTDAMWVKAGPPGTKPAKQEQNDQIDWRVDGSGTTLYAIDWNDNNAANGILTLNYQLNVNGHAPLDPIIDNGGSVKPPPPPPPPPPSGQAAGAAPAPAPAGLLGGLDWSCLIIGLVIGLIIGLILCWWRRKTV
jgi:hypothetical protein